MSNIYGRIPDYESKATAAHFMEYFQEHPTTDGEYVQQVLGATLIEQLVKQNGVNASGYVMMARLIIYDHTVGEHGVTKEPVPQVVDESKEIFYFDQFMRWADEAVSLEFGDAALDTYRSARAVAAREKR